MTYRHKEAIEYPGKLEFDHPITKSWKLLCYIEAHRTVGIESEIEPRKEFIAETAVVSWNGPF